jgi:diguanylate cyclase (GGDEF)-like protein
MIGFGAFGLLVFYFSLYYRPMRLLDRMLSSVVSEREYPMYFFDEDKRCIWMNRAGAQFLNLEEQDLEKAENELKRQFSAIHPGATEWKDQLTMNVNGEERYVELTKQPIIDSKGKQDGFYFYIRDLTEEQREAAQKLYNARHDKLTGLFNRDYLYESTRELLEQNPGEPYLIISAEITDLKVINDLYGNAFGDKALKYSADWLRENRNLMQNSVFGRLGGDSFGVCIPEKQFGLDRMEYALSNLTVLEGETKYRMLIHVGIYRVTERDIDVSLMYDRAVLALEGIKDDYHYHTAWYDHSMRDKVVRNRQISEELASALEDGQIRPWLQPIVNREGKIVGAEALVRWIHPKEGIRSPITFIPVFEKNGMIAEVDRCIWRKSCEILAQWKREGKDLFISVNISPRDFYLLDVPAELTQLIREYEVEPEKLRLEITESMMMDDADARIETLRALRAYGFIIEMDDFGSGYSSLNLLREMPVDVLKIDMVFLRKASQDMRAKAIVEDIIGLSGKLGITSLTEGVETKEQYDSLTEMGCQLYQGYYFSKPMPVEDFEKFM